MRLRLSALAGLLAVLLGVARTDAQTATPLSLREVRRLVVERSPDLAEASARIGEAAARVREAESAFWPQLSARLSYGRTDNPAQAFGWILSQRRFSPGLNFNQPGATQNFRPEIVAAMPLFRGGQHFFQREAAKLGVDAATYEQGAIRNALLDAAMAGYHALAAAPEHVEAARTSVTAVEGALAAARVRLETGTGLRSDVLSLEARLAAAREGHLRAANGVELARAGLRFLLALPAETPLDVEPPTDGEDAPNEASLADLLATARARRPEVRAAAAFVAMRGKERDAERAAFLPRVDVVGSYGHDNHSLKLSHQRDNWFVGASAEVDLFSGLGKVSRLKAAEERLRQAEEAERRLQLDLEQEVHAALLQLQEARQRVVVGTAGLEAAEEALRLVQEQYRAGAVVVTRYLEAESARSEARSRSIAARQESRRAASALNKAIGHWAEEKAE